MITERVTRKKEMGVEQVKGLFVNPEDPESANDLANLSSEAIKVMAQIYATRGNVNEMSEASREWLTSPQNAKTPLERQLGEILKRESTTRLFDNYFVGQIHPQGSKIGILSNLIGAYMNTNRIYKGVSPAEAEMETDSIRWLSEMFGYDTSVSGGNITTGGTTANIEALWVAREKSLQNNKSSLRKINEPLYVFVSKYRHYSIDKACQMLGLRLITIPDNKDYKIDVNILNERVRRIKENGGKIAAIIGLAGETETGMIEDLKSISEIAKKYNTYFHVDAAYGGPYVISEESQRFSGINFADSITVDPHKMLYTPYSAGCVLFKNENDHLLISKVQETRYIRNIVPRVEGSMSSSGVIATWATKELLGNEGIASLLNHNLKLTKYANTRIEESSILRSIFKPELNTLLIGLNNNLNISTDNYNEIMTKIETQAEEIRPGKTIYISRNGRIDGDRDALRFLVNSPFTTKENIDEIIEFIESEVKHNL